MKQSKVAIYVRVSTARQSNGLESQERALVDYCKARGYHDFLIFKDENISGAKSSRPGLDRLMVAAEQGQIKSVVVYSFSRFARSTKHLLAALEQFNK